MKLDGSRRGMRTLTVVRRFGSLAMLAACVVAALVFKRFVFVAYYPVLMSVAVALGFALSLIRPKSLCQTIAERTLSGVLPDGAERYCRRLTLAWCLLLLANAGIAWLTVFAPRVVWIVWNCALSYVLQGAFFALETCYRRRRFAVAFRTSGSTANPKTIVKTFDTLAREVGYHRTKLADVLADRPLFLSTVEPQHMYGMLWRHLLPRAAGCPVDADVILTPETLLAKMRTAEKVFLVTTPSFLERFAAYAALYDVPQNCVEITTSGALLTAEVSAVARRVFGRAPLEIFGSTETGGVAFRRQDAARPETALWTVFDPVKVAADADGRLVVRSPFSFRRVFTMGDGVALADDGRRFTLLGRRDRLVKIAEQRVLLPEMEEAMKALPEIRDAALCPLDGPHGPSLGAVVVLTDAAAAAAISKRKLAWALRTELAPIFPRGTVPRKYRFVHELPRNAQGKVQTGALKKEFETQLVEPFVSDVASTADTWSATFVFDPDAPYFQGHFPGCAVLPGVVQLGLAHHFAEAYLRRPCVLKTVKKMKFTHSIVPGVAIRFTLVKKSETELMYDYRKGETRCSSGVLCLA